MEHTGGKDQRDSVDEEAGLFATSTSEGAMAMGDKTASNEGRPMG